MSISFIAAGTLAAAPDTITAAYPAGATAGRLAVLQVVSGHPSDSVPSTPSGWSLAGSFSGGGGVFGLNTGPRRMTWFVRVLAGSDAAPTTAIPSGSSGSVISGRIWILDRTAGTSWRWAATFGQDTVSHTAFSAVCQTALTWKPGDFALIGYGLPNQSSAASAEAITATGITFAAVTHVSDLGASNGNGARNIQDRSSVTAGTGTQAPTVTATLSAASTGVAGVLRVREASSVLTVNPQSVFPPRNLVAATSLVGDDIVTATLYRQVGGQLVTVRAAGGVDVTGVSSLLRVDAEQPFGVPVTYAADLTDVNGTVWRIVSGSITSTVNSDVISDAVQGTGAAVTIQAWPDKKRDRDGTVFNVGGRLVAVTRQRSAAQATITVRTLTDADGDDLQDVLDGATEGVILIRKQITMPGVDNYLAALSDSEDRTWYNPVRYWTLDTIETEPWPDFMEAAGFTLQDIANNYSTLSDLAADFTTLLAIALFDFG
ncbi:hypothetical protein ABZ468_25970 [Streptomyces sp. NPDC005708]|uniref:hypothetical protein n=1 Tax=Streptomyces sp. NPDC005708 TaxID=3154564 RepID=UPI0033C95AC7